MCSDIAGCREAVWLFYHDLAYDSAVAKANITVEEKDRLSEGEIGEIAQNIEDKCSEMNRAMDVETIQDWVEADIMRP